jgi:hypothetical protein
MIDRGVGVTSHPAFFFAPAKAKRCGLLGVVPLEAGPIVRFGSACSRNKGKHMGLLLGILYIGAIVGVSIYVLMLASRMVKAHERAAGALERLAHRLKTDA